MTLWQPPAHLIDRLPDLPPVGAEAKTILHDVNAYFRFHPTHGWGVYDPATNQVRSLAMTAWPPTCKCDQFTGSPLLIPTNMEHTRHNQYCRHNLAFVWYDRLVAQVLSDGLAAFIPSTSKIRLAWQAGQKHAATQYDLLRVAQWIHQYKQSKLVPLPATNLVMERHQ